MFSLVASGRVARALQLVVPVMTPIRPVKAVKSHRAIRQIKLAQPIKVNRLLRLVLVMVFATI